MTPAEKDALNREFAELVGLCWHDWNDGRGETMTREEALEKISELSCAYQHIRMTDCPHCAKEVDNLVKLLMKSKEVKDENKSYEAIG